MIVCCTFTHSTCVLSLILMMMMMIVVVLITMMMSSGLIVSEMTYNVSSGTLNTTIPYLWPVATIFHEPWNFCVMLWNFENVANSAVRQFWLIVCTVVSHKALCTSICHELNFTLSLFIIQTACIKHWAQIWLGCCMVCAGWGMLCLVTLIFCVFNQPHHVTLAADSDLDNIHVAISESSLQKISFSVSGCIVEFCGKCYFYCGTVVTLRWQLLSWLPSGCLFPKQ